MLNIGKLAAGPGAARHYVDQVAEGARNYAGEGEAPGVRAAVRTRFRRGDGAQAAPHLRFDLHVRGEDPAFVMAQLGQTDPASRSASTPMQCAATRATRSG